MPPTPPRPTPATFAAVRRALLFIPESHARPLWRGARTKCPGPGLLGPCWAPAVCIGSRGCQAAGPASRTLDHTPVRLPFSGGGGVLERAQGVCLGAQTFGFFAPVKFTKESWGITVTNFSYNQVSTFERGKKSCHLVVVLYISTFFNTKKEGHNLSLRDGPCPEAQWPVCERTHLGVRVHVRSPPQPPHRPVSVTSPREDPWHSGKNLQRLQQGLTPDCMTLGGFARLWNSVPSPCEIGIMISISWW